MSENIHSLRYGMLGGDPGSALDKLEKYTGEIDWTYLRRHFENGVLIWVDPSLSLVEVGHVISIDDAEQVQSWKQSGGLVIPSAPHAAHWENTRARFTALVVSPFVLIQPKA